MTEVFGQNSVFAIYVNGIRMSKNQCHLLYYLNTLFHIKRILCALCARNSGDIMAVKVKVENVVASTQIDKIISLDKLLTIMEASEYEPEQFPGLVYRLDNPKVATLIFRSGKIICVGARSTAAAKEALEIVVRKIKKIGLRVDETKLKVKIENIVVSIDLGAELNLDQLAFQLEDSEYEPEQFPGLVYRIPDPKVAFLLFSSGRVVCAGAKSLAAVKDAVEKLEKKLRELKVKLPK